MSAEEQEYDPEEPEKAEIGPVVDAVSAGNRAERLADSVLGQPIDNDQATELAKAYAAIALVQVIERVHEAMAKIGSVLEENAEQSRETAETIERLIEMKQPAEDVE